MEEEEKKKRLLDVEGSLGLGEGTDDLGVWAGKVTTNCRKAEKGRKVSAIGEATGDEWSGSDECSFT
jgi:hypothetical protein